MRKLRFILVFCVSLVLPAVHARGAEPLLLLPSETAVVIRSGSLDKLSGGLKEMLAAFGPIANPAVEGVDQALNHILAIDADGAAIDRTQPVYLAGFAMDGEDQVVRVVKAADEARLRRAVVKAAADETLAVEKAVNGFEKVSKDGTDWYFARRDGWVMYTRREDVVKLLTTNLSTDASLASVFAGRAAELAGEGDAAVLVNVARLIDVYGDKLEEQRDKLRRQIDNLPKEFLGGDSSATDPRATKKMYADLAELAINAVGDAQWLAGRVNFSNAGVSIAALAGIKGDTATSGLLKDNPPVVFETLGLMPGGSPVYYAYGAYPTSLANWRRAWTRLAYGEESDVTKQLLAALDSYLAAEPGATVGSFAFPSGVDTGINTIALTQAKDAEKLRGSLAVSEPAANQQDTTLFTQSVELTPKAETYQNHTVDLLTTRVKFKDVADPGQAVGQKFLEKLFGGDTMQNRITTIEGLVVRAGGNGAKYLQNAVDSLQTGEKVLALDEAYSATRDQLPEKANLLLLLNAPRLLIDVIGMLKSIPPLDVALAQAPIHLGVQPAASYTGISVATDPQALRLDAYLPVAQVQGVLKVFGQ